MLCYRSGELVYIPIPKNASESYSALFRDRLNWQPIQIDSVDWDRDHVFAHLQDPETRHWRGILQAMKFYNLFDLMDHPKFKLLLSTAVFDLHSYPISAALGNLVNLIDWILLDHADVSHALCTKKLLAEHGIIINVDDVPMLNVSIPEHKKIMEQLRTTYKSTKRTGTLAHFYNLDFFLYNSVNQYTKFYKINQLPWSQCSWLKNFPHKSHII